MCSFRDCDQMKHLPTKGYVRGQRVFDSGLMLQEIPQFDAAI